MEIEKKGLLARLKEGLKKTNKTLISGITYATTGRISIDNEVIQELEDALITADIGMPTTISLIDSLKKAVKNKEITTVDGIRPFLSEKIAELAGSVKPVLETPAGNHTAPHVILVVGVNGAGKTTTIGKLANFYQSSGKSVLLSAGDTFRAAAIEQLDEWSRRVGCDIVKHQPNSDPSAVAFDAMKAAVARKKDIVIVDTAGRLHTRSNLMEELAKVRRIIGREVEGAPHETLLVLDGTTGQNALNQAKEFHSKINLTGLVLTKLDGTSKGGAVIGIITETKLPVKFIGIGEKIDDLQPFDPKLFAEAILHP
ncbi:MAG: signal recognition particle-docking protein FtsY [Nitrospinota bacterium]|nr:signal recognition particle-docking protein FtsY [Nitrospinota bacterium]